MTPELWGFTPRDGVFLVVFIFGLGGIYQRLLSVERKVESFITKEVIVEKEKATAQLHAALRDEIEAVRDRVRSLEGRRA